MHWLQRVTFACVALGGLCFAPAARADWVKSADGYRYFWSDENKQWYWQDDKTVLAFMLEGDRESVHPAANAFLFAEPQPYV